MAESIKTHSPACGEVSQSTTGISSQTTLFRIASIDIFRGLTMLVMIFVNDLSSVHGLPWWTYHMPAQVDGMTYVDMVFPAFLFIVGMAIPLSIDARLRKNESIGQLWAHVVLRTISLLVLGLILANAHLGSGELIGIRPNLWALLALVGAILFWNVYPRSERFGTLFRVLKFGGLILMLAMLVIFRRVTRDGHIAWLDTSYWEILGLIGWAYLSASILYIPTRRWLWSPAVWFVLLLFLNITASAHWAPWLEKLPPYIWPFESGSSCLIVMGGLVTSHIFLARQPDKPFAQKLRSAMLFSAISFVAGWFLTPLGISKIRATPTWGLYCIASSVIIFCILYWIGDVRRQTGWAWFARPAGTNTLTTYLVPDLVYYIGAADVIEGTFDQGPTGVLRAVIFTFAMLGLAAVLTRCKVRMQL